MRNKVNQIISGLIILSSIFFIILFAGNYKNNIIFSLFWVCFCIGFLVLGIINLRRAIMGKPISFGSFSGFDLKKNGFELTKSVYREKEDYIGIAYVYENAWPYFYFIKKHYCEKCNGLLEKQAEITIEENYNFGSHGEFTSSTIGPAKVIRYNHFHCLQCGWKISTKELRELERRKR